MAGWLPGVVLPVNPSTLRDSKDLQKSDPSGYPSEGVNEPSDLRDFGPFACALPLITSCRIICPVLTVTQLTERLVASYARAGGINHLDGKNLPSKRAITQITIDLLRLVFPGLFDEKPIHSSEINVDTASLLALCF